MTAELNIGSRRELFVDRFLVDRLENTRLRLHEPVSGGVAIRIDRPWEGPENFGGCVIRHRDRYLLYYRAIEHDNDRTILCVAVSEDGVTWVKPTLGLVEHSGRRDTNIVTSVCGTANFECNSAPWIDTRPGVPEDELIKATTSEPLSGEKHTSFIDPAGPKRLVFWGSADGFTFRKLAPQPELVSDLPNCFDGGNTMFWSETEGRYVLYYRCWSSSGRSMARTTSEDFFHWSVPVIMAYGDAPAEQFYVNNTRPYFRAPHIYIAPAARFMEGRRVVTDAQVEAIGLKMARGHFYGNDCSDAVLLTSRAGSTQYDRTFMETFIRPGLGASNWVSRTNYPLTGILPAGPNQMMLFVTRHYMQESWHIERMLLRTDGFASASVPWTGGEMVTKPLTFTGSELELNYRTGAPGFLRVEIQDAKGTPIPDYTLDDCPEIIGDEIDRVVAWKHGTDVGRLAGRAVRLRWVMKDADLFALKFRRRPS
jgi:hypothetical protein